MLEGVIVRLRFQMTRTVGLHLCCPNKSLDWSRESTHEVVRDAHYRYTSMEVAVEPKRTAWEFHQRNPNPLGLGGVNIYPCI